MAAVVVLGGVVVVVDVGWAVMGESASPGVVSAGSSSS